MAKAKKVLGDIMEVAGKTALSLFPGPLGTLFTAMVGKAKENALAKRAFRS